MAATAPRPPFKCGMNDGDPPRQVATRYESFPQDGKLYWLRWLDGIDVRGHGSGSPAIHACLSLLPDTSGGRHTSTVQEAAGMNTPVACPVHVASLPDLPLGIVFKNGVCVDALRMVRRTFAFDRSTCTSELLRCRDESPAPQPAWWKYNWSVLPASAYALGGWRSSFCLVLQEGNRQLIVPASEVFRVFCAPESRLAEALVSGPWNNVRDRIINPSWTEKCADHWEIGLRTGLTERSTLPAAAFDLTDYGGSVAGMIHSQLVGSSAGKRDLKADIPYEWDAIEMDVEGVVFPSNIQDDVGLDRFLCLRITGIRWPKPLLGLPSGLVYRLDNNNTMRNPDASQQETDERKWPGHTPAPLPDSVDDTVPISPDAGASKNVERLASLVPPPPPMIGGPAITRMELEEAEGPPRERRRGPPGDPARHASPTRESSGGEGAAPLSHVPSCGMTPTGFGEIAATLDHLHEAKSIDGWGPLAPEDDKSAFREGFPVWCFPGFDEQRRIAWAYTDSFRRRTALVARITIRTEIGPHVLHLLEIERRLRPDSTITEGFNMLLLHAAETDVQRAVAVLLRLTGSKRGVWPDDAEWSGSWSATGGGAASIARHRHDYVDVPKDSGSRRLDSTLLLQWLRRNSGVKSK